MLKATFAYFPNLIVDTSENSRCSQNLDLTESCPKSSFNCSLKKILWNIRCTANFSVQIKYINLFGREVIVHFVLFFVRGWKWSVIQSEIQNIYQQLHWEYKVLWEKELTIFLRTRQKFNMLRNILYYLE